MVCNLKNMVVVAAAVAACSESSWSSDVGVAMTPVAALTIYNRRGLVQAQNRQRVPPRAVKVFPQIPVVAEPVSEKVTVKEVAPARTGIYFKSFSAGMKEFLESEITCLSLKKKESIYDMHQKEGKTVQQIKSFFLRVQSEYERLESFGVTFINTLNLFKQQCSEEREVRDSDNNVVEVRVPTEKDVQAYANTKIWDKLKSSALLVSDNDESTDLKALKTFLIGKSRTNDEVEGFLDKLHSASNARREAGQQKIQFVDEILGSVAIVCTRAKADEFAANVRQDLANGNESRTYKNRAELFRSFSILEENSDLAPKIVDELRENIKVALQTSRNFLATEWATPEEFQEVEELVDEARSEFNKRRLPFTVTESNHGVRSRWLGRRAQKPVRNSTKLQRGRANNFGINFASAFKRVWGVNVDEVDGVLNSHNSNPKPLLFK